MVQMEGTQCAGTRDSRFVLRDSRAVLSVSARTRSRVDPRWTGIIEVLVWGLAGAVRWEPDSVVLQLPDYQHHDRSADLDGLRLCLSRMGMRVVFDPSGVTLFDASLVGFLRQLADAGLMVDAGSPAA
jgi:hypothetical protein